MKNLKVKIPDKKMTWLEYIKQHSKNSNIKLEECAHLGLIPTPCDCKQESCEGWAMVSRKNIKNHVKLYVNS